MIRVDAYNHVIPKPYFDKFAEIAPDPRIVKFFGSLAALHDDEAHLRLLDRFDDYGQVLSLANPPIEMLGSPDQTPALARLANDGLAARVRRAPDRFPTFIASLPMNNPDAAVAEANRAIRELGARGVQMFTNVLGKPLSAPEFYPLFETMAQHDLPIWIHPMRGPNFPDYATEDASEFEIWFTFGWPYETSACMTRLIYSGLFDKLPDIKIITHHFGGMIPFFAEKIGIGFAQIAAGDAAHNPVAAQAGLKKQPKEYFRMFYADTATNGSAAAAACGLDFFGPDRSLFATDAPFDPEGGSLLIRETLRAVDALGLDDVGRGKIYGGNLMRLMKLA
ncbi:MAG: amidohydrolase family protein [Rhodospirillaceae bacterium]